MRLFPSDRYPLPLPVGHRFPAIKYAILRRRLEGHATAGVPFEFVEPHAATDDELLRVHDRAYVGRVLSGTLSAAEIRRIGFPWSAALVERSLRSTGAAVDAAAAAVADGVAASLAGGTHHAGSDWGEGYCLFNDTAVAAREMQARGLVERVLILDCDVHQGNGTAQIFSSDPTVFTMSIHGARNFPLRKHPGSLDVGLDDGAGDDEYLAALVPALAESFDRGRPDLVLYIAGADPFAGDRIGRLRLSKAGLRERDRLVLEAARQARAPVAIVCGGGYCSDVEEIVDIHAATMLLAAGPAARFRGENSLPESALGW
ncbi:MAG: histone deacetylase [Planctomycetia bacterium]|jgi:acetoin utilization deacetylase AcuC-like enzyme